MFVGAENRHGNGRTGKENRVVFFCPQCGARQEPKAWPLQEAAVGMVKCEQCPRMGGLRFVAYEEGVEEAEAERVIAGGWA